MIKEKYVEKHLKNENAINLYRFIEAFVVTHNMIDNYRQYKMDYACRPSINYHNFYVENARTHRQIFTLTFNEQNNKIIFESNLIITNRAFRVANGRNWRSIEFKRSEHHSDRYVIIDDSFFEFLNAVFLD